jgi:hypothetical protein
MDVPACFSGISATDGAIITISVFMILRYWQYGKGEAINNRLK